jgi:hypothetical protein
MGIHPSARRTHARVPQHAAQIPIQTRAAAAEATVLQYASSTPQAARGAALLDTLHTRRFAIALWCSVLLFVAGVGLVYHGSAPDRALLFSLGVGSLVCAGALFRFARSKLLTHLEREAKKEGLIAEAAQQRAHAVFERVVVSPQTPLPARESGDAMERLLDKYPLA